MVLSCCTYEIGYSYQNYGFRQLAVLELNELPPLAYQLFLLSRKVMIPLKVALRRNTTLLLYSCNHCFRARSSSLLPKFAVTFRTQKSNIYLLQPNGPLLCTYFHVYSRNTFLNFLAPYSRVNKQAVDFNRVEGTIIVHMCFAIKQDQV